jgi:branched-chain amino acid transport system substrate-binding protein
MAYGLSAAETAGTNASSLTPFRRLREATLGYHGSEIDLTNLTEIRVGWFGPTNLSDPVNGDLWWAANLAIREVNEQSKSPPERGVHAASPSGVSSVSADPKTLSSSAPKRSEGCAPAASDKPSFQSLPFRLVPRWAVDPWGTGVSQLARMVYEEQPLAVLGSVDSASTHLAEQVVAKANLPLVSPIATDNSVTLAGVSWMFSCAPADNVIARVLADAIQPRLRSPADKLVLLATTDHESRMTTRELVRELSHRGRRPDFRFDVRPGAVDTSRQMQAAADAKPAVVLIIAGAEDAARLARAVRASVGAVAIFGGPSLSRRTFLVLAGPAAEGVCFPLLFVADSTDANAVHFVERFSAERHYLPDYTAVLTYDATRLLIEAIRRAGPNRARVRETLAQLSPWPGIAGSIQFDGTGQNTRTNLCMGTICDGTVVPLPQTPSPNTTNNKTAKL